MPTLWIEQGGARASFVFAGTPLLMEALALAGRAVEAPCGGRGTCLKCAVLGLAGEVSPPTAAEARAGVRLACQARLLGDATVRLQPARVWEGIETGMADEATGAFAGMPAHADVGREGTPGAWAGAIGAGAVQAPVAATGATSGPADAKATVAGAEAASAAARRGMPMAGRYGAAVDLGTTTVAARVYDLATGAALGTHALVNPQTAVAADVMGRISAALGGQAQRLRALAEAAVRGAVDSACRAAGITGVDALCVAGNTVMLHLLTGRDPRPLGAAPFQAEHLFGEVAMLGDAPMYLPRCAGAYMGADLTCAALATGLVEQGETALLCDIGTNGELMLWHRGALFAASAPAGPAFEGGEISQGVGGVRGAIDRVWVEGGRLGAHVIGGGEATGVCGSGVIDAVAALLSLGLVDAAGAAEAEAFPLRDAVRLTAGDVRAVQLAKAAVCAAAETLLAAAGIKAGDVRQVLLAGGFGSHVRVAAAAAIGLLPPQLMARARAVGNAALAGAAMLLLDQGLWEKADRIAGMAQVLQLGGDEGFERRFMGAIGFPAGEEE